MKRMLFSFLLLLLVAGCASDSVTTTNANNREVTFRVLSLGQSSGLTQPKFLTFRSATEFATFWNIHTAATNAPIPKINFQQQMVIAVFMGEQRTGGYAIAIERIIELEQELQVFVTLVKPKPGTNRVMMISQPYMIVALARSDKSVTFKFRSAS